MQAPGQSLDATALVHEAYVRLVGGEIPQQWDGKGHFFAAAAKAMQRILVESARRKQRLKHGGGIQRVDLEPDLLAAETPPQEILDIDEGLNRLTEIDRQTGELVRLHYFAGLTIEEAAELLDISARTAYRVWAYGRAWLKRELRNGSNVG